jgi:hypothetical protein
LSGNGSVVGTMTAVGGFVGSGSSITNANATTIFGSGTIPAAYLGNALSATNKFITSTSGSGTNTKFFGTTILSTNTATQEGMTADTVSGNSQLKTTAIYINAISASATNRLVDDAGGMIASGTMTAVGGFKGQSAYITNATLVSGLTMGKTWLAVANTNTISVTNAGTDLANGTYKWSGGAYTNYNSPAHFWTNVSAGSWALNSNAVTLYSLSTVTGLTTIISGAGPAAGIQFGGRVSLAGFEVEGYLASTNLAKRIFDATNTAYLSGSNYTWGVSNNGWLSDTALTNYVIGISNQTVTSNAYVLKNNGTVTNLHGTASLSSLTATNLVAWPTNLLVSGAGRANANGTYTALIPTSIVPAGYNNPALFTNAATSYSMGYGLTDSSGGNYPTWHIFDDGFNDVYHWTGSAWASSDGGDDPAPTSAGSFTPVILNGAVKFPDGTVQTTAFSTQIGSNVVSAVDGSLANNSIKINNYNDSHVSFLSVAFSPYENLAVFENQIGGVRQGSYAFGVDTNGTALMASILSYRWVNATTAYPHPNLMLLDTTNGNLSIGGVLYPTNGVDVVGGGITNRAQSASKFTATDANKKLVDAPYQPQSVASNLTVTAGSGIALTTNITAGATNVTIATSGSSAVSTNTAAFTTTSNPTNQFVAGTLYTNFPQRSLLVGAVALSSAVGGNATITLNYTNNNIGYTLPMQIGSGVAMTDYIPFSIPLSTNATFKFVSTMGAGASGNVTNAVLWQQ